MKYVKSTRTDDLRMSLRKKNEQKRNKRHLAVDNVYMQTYNTRILMTTSETICLLICFFKICVLLDLRIFISTSIIISHNHDPSESVRSLTALLACFLCFK